MARDDRVTRRIRVFHERFVGQTLPFLMEKGWDAARGGLVERLRRDGNPDDMGFRRVMLHARQLYVFSSWAGRLGDADFAAHADRIFAYMTASFWDPRDGGWFAKLTLDGAVLEPEKDLYGHAFALFGLATYRHALGRADATPWIARTLAVLNDRFRRADGSFADRMSRDFQDISGERRSQNPHMHLLEASLALAEATGEVVYRHLAEELLMLFENRFLDAEPAVVLEHLDTDFRPHPDIGHKVEPGHHFEWAWLLERAARILDVERYRAVAERVFRTGLDFGWDAVAGGVFDQVDRRNSDVLLATKRCWPVTELIKARAVLPDGAAGPSLGQAIDLMLDRYLAPNGHWTERFNADWSPADPTMPSSSAYHISMALQELQRIHPSG